MRPAHSRAEGTLEVPEGDPTGHTNLTIGLYASDHSGEMSIIHVYNWAEGPPPVGNALATPPLPPDNPPSTGLWKGSWRNSVGESGADTLDLKEDAKGNLVGTWSGSVPVSGRRTDADHIQLKGRTATREFQIQGVLQGRTLKLTYVARRVNLHSLIGRDFAAR